MGIFSVLLMRLKMPGWAHFCSLIALMMGPGFLASSMDGSEFLAGVSLILLGWLFLIIAEQSGSILPQLASSTCLALATAVRLEFAAALVLAGAFFAMPWRQLRGMMLQALIYFGSWTALSLLLWAPVLAGPGFQRPYDLHLDWLDQIMISGYKLVFQVYSPALWLVFVFLFFALGRVIIGYFKKGVWPDFVFRSSLLMVVTYHTLFFLYPTKPQFLLAALPMLLVLIGVCVHFRWLALTCGLLAMHAFVRPDIFSNRQYLGLHLTEGGYVHLVRSKPQARAFYLQQIINGLPKQTTENVVVVADLWPWDQEYLSEFYSLDPNGELADWAYVENKLNATLLLRSALDFFPTKMPSDAIIYVDEALYREIFHRHEPFIDLDPVQSNQGKTLHLFTPEKAN